MLTEEILPESRLLQKSSSERPKAIILGGQSGAGKGGLAKAAERELLDDVVRIDPDKLRDFHPDVEEFRAASPYNWSGLTHPDASAWADELRDAAVAGRKNLIFDTTLSNGEWSSDLISDMQAKGYEVEIRVVASPKLESELGVDKRFAEKLDDEGYGRHVPEGARDATYDKLPGSLDLIHARTDVRIRIFNREGVELYDSRTDPRPPGLALQEARDARLKDPAITHKLRDGWREQQAWHRDLPQALPNDKIDPRTRDNLLVERSNNHVVDGVDRAARQAVDVDHVIRIRPTRIRAGSTLGIAGLALDAYDAADTLRTSGRLRSEGNDTAAESELIHFGARSVGGFAGAGLGMTAGAVAGVETGPGLVVTGALGGIAGAVAGDEIAAWTDNRRIYNQQDRQGHAWTYDPDQPAQGWQRHAPIDASNDGIDNPRRGPLRASPALANELNYRSTSTSVELMLGGPPSQRDPFVQPAKASDPPSAFPAAWTRDTDQQAWQREVMVAFTERGMSQKRVDVASPERADELDRAAAQTVLQNAANSPAAIAARYEEAYARNGWAAHGPMPDAVRHARSDPDTLIASDANRYQRRANGEWVSEGLIYNATATGNLREELDATREVLRARLPSPRTVQAPPPPTPDDRLRDTVMGAYANAGVVPDAARLAASVAAVRATQTMHGLDPDTTALQLQRGAQGRLDVDSPIASLRLDADGKTYVVAAVTTTEDIQRAQGPTPAADARPAPSATMAQSDRLVEQYLHALAAGDDEGVRAASIAFLDSDDGQRLVAGSQERTLQHQQHLPGRDRPLFVQAMQHLERLGPEAVGYADQADMERIAGVVACEATQRRMPSIDDIHVRDDGHLRVSCHNERNPVLSQYTQIDGLLASFQPLERSFQKLEVETQRQAQQDMQRAHERQASAQHGMWM
nr:zeta toxin family protein [Pseudoxanthomonas sp. Root630]